MFMRKKKRLGRGRGRYTNHKDEDDEEKKPQDKSKVWCYNCDKLGHYTNEFRKDKKDEKAQVAKEDEGETSLLMIVVEDHKEFVLERVSKTDLEDDFWYPKIGVSSHMMGSKSLFYKIDETYDDTVKFGDGSRISIKVRGKILLHPQNEKSKSLSNVLYTS